MSKTARDFDRILLVEGETERRVLPEVVERHGITWEVRRNEPIVWIEPCGGIQGILKPGVIEAQLKVQSRKSVGIVVDADTNPDACWTSVRQRCLKFCPAFPEERSPHGVIAETTDGVRFGVWMMPDNLQPGMLESLLRELIPEASKPLWEFAQATVAEASARGAPFLPSHRTKAEVHTWLAWQNEPGRQLHQAVKERILASESPTTTQFVQWFRTLFQ